MCLGGVIVSRFCGMVHVLAALKTWALSHLMQQAAIVVILMKDCWKRRKTPIKHTHTHTHTHTTDLSNFSFTFVYLNKLIQSAMKFTAAGCLLSTSEIKSMRSYIYTLFDMIHFLTPFFPPCSISLDYSVLNLILLLVIQECLSFWTETDNISRMVILEVWMYYTTRWCLSLRNVGVSYYYS